MMLLHVTLYTLPSTNSYSFFKTIISYYFWEPFLDPLDCPLPLLTHTSSHTPWVWCVSHIIPHNPAKYFCLSLYRAGLLVFIYEFNPWGQNSFSCVYSCWTASGTYQVPQNVFYSKMEATTSPRNNGKLTLNGTCLILQQSELFVSFAFEYPAMKI